MRNHNTITLPLSKSRCAKLPPGVSTALYVKLPLLICGSRHSRYCRWILHILRDHNSHIHVAWCPIIAAYLTHISKDYLWPKATITNSHDKTNFGYIPQPISPLNHIFSCNFLCKFRNFYSSRFSLHHATFACGSYVKVVFTELTCKMNSKEWLRT